MDRENVEDSLDATGHISNNHAAGVTMILRIGDLTPKVKNAAFIAENATVAGDVTLGAETTVWFGAVLRGDIAPITIGDRTNIQDNAVLHVDEDTPLLIGSDITIGHAAIVHACTIGDGSLIGMGACVLNNAVIPPRCLVAAGTLVRPGKSFPEGSLIAGSPARVIGPVRKGDLEAMRQGISVYIERGKLYAREAKRV